MAEIQRIETLERLDFLMEGSSERPLWIFKHSLTCPISSSAYRAYRRFVEERSDEDSVFALVEVQNARQVSKAVAERTGIFHQSPQVLLVKKSTVAWHASHWKIEAAALLLASQL